MLPTPRPGSRAQKLALLAPAFLVCALLLEALAPAPARAADPGIHARARRDPAPSHEVYGYLPYWQVDAGTAARLDYSRLSTIAFFAVPIRSNGTLDRNAAGYRAYVSRAAGAITNAAHARGVRVVPTFQVFNPATLRKLLSSRPAQDRFIREALALMARRRADGANVDVEPIPSALASRYGRFMRRFGQAIHRRFPGAQLAVATPAIVSDRLLRGLAPSVDRLFVMTYDYHWRGSRRPGPVAPLSAGPHNVAKTIANYLRIVPRNKIILGVPFYGYSWPVVRVNGTWRVRANPARYGGVRAVTYASAHAFLAAHPSVQVHRDSRNGSWFRYRNAADGTAREVHFEDSVSAAAKFNYAITRGLAGVGIWTIGYDDWRSGMTAALRKTFVHPVRRVTGFARVAAVRTSGGSVRVAATVVLRDRGSRAERGMLRWRIVDPRGRTVGGGSRVVALWPGGRASLGLPVAIGRASALPAGTYRLVVRFSVGSWTPLTTTVRFHQPH